MGSGWGTSVHWPVSRPSHGQGMKTEQLLGTRTDWGHVTTQCGSLAGMLEQKGAICGRTGDIWIKSGL